MLRFDKNEMRWRNSTSWAVVFNALGNVFEQHAIGIRLYAMNTMLTSLVTAPYILLARSFVIILGCIGVCMGNSRNPSFLADSSIERIATRIIAGDTFKTETLAQQLPITESIKSASCRPAALRSAAIIELRMMGDRSFGK